MVTEPFEDFDSSVLSSRNSRTFDLSPAYFTNTSNDFQKFDAWLDARMRVQLLCTLNLWPATPTRRVKLYSLFTNTATEMDYTAVMEEGSLLK